MLMGLSDVLALARTPEEKEQIRESFLRLRDMKDEDIDYSDIPPKTDFSHFKPLKLHHGLFEKQQYTNYFF